MIPKRSLAAALVALCVVGMSACAGFKIPQIPGLPALSSTVSSPSTALFAIGTVTSDRSGVGVATYADPTGGVGIESQVGSQRFYVAASPLAPIVPILKMILGALCSFVPNLPGLSTATVADTGGVGASAVVRPCRAGP